MEMKYDFMPLHFINSWVTACIYGSEIWLDTSLLYKFMNKSMHMWGCITYAQYVRNGFQLILIVSRSCQPFLNKVTWGVETCSESLMAKDTLKFACFISYCYHSVSWYFNSVLPLWDFLKFSSAIFCAQSSCRNFEVPYQIIMRQNVS